MENEDINQKILKIWDDFPEESGENSPLLYPRFEPNKILFIGLNPSLSEKAFNAIFRDTKYAGKFSFKEFFEKKNMYKYADVYIEGEKLAKEKYSYFKKFKEISKDFEHIDLFVYRKTKQESFKRDCLNSAKELKIEGFWLEQLKMSIDAIKEASPKIIIVANAFASDIINKYKELFMLDNNDKDFYLRGYDIIRLGDRKVPIFFSSMLTQQRALDNHTFRRLNREVKILLEK